MSNVCNACGMICGDTCYKPRNKTLIDEAYDEIKLLKQRVKNLESELSEAIDERDYWEGKAAELSNDVGRLFGVSFGEYSNMNCPVENALSFTANLSKAGE